MAIAFDDHSGSDESATSSPFSWTHTTGAGANRLLVVAVVLYGYGHTPECTGVTYDDVAMTQVRSDSCTSANTSIWFLHNPASGANKVISVTAASDFHEGAGASASYTGAAQVSTADAVNGTTGGSSSVDSSVTVTTVADNCWAVAVGVSYSTGSVTSLQTARHTGWLNNNYSGYAFEDLNGPKTPAGAQTMGFHIFSDDLYAISAASFAPSLKCMPVFMNQYRQRR
jgi:hypothetical protein